MKFSSRRDVGLPWMLAVFPLLFLAAHYYELDKSQDSSHAAGVGGTPFAGSRSSDFISSVREEQAKPRNAPTATADNNDDAERKQRLAALLAPTSAASPTVVPAPPTSLTAESSEALPASSANRQEAAGRPNSASIPAALLPTGAGKAGPENAHGELLAPNQDAEPRPTPSSRTGNNNTLYKPDASGVSSGNNLTLNRDISSLQAAAQFASDAASLKAAIRPDRNHSRSSTESATGLSSADISTIVGSEPQGLSLASARTRDVSPPSEFWTGAGGDNNWSTAANWNLGIAPSPSDNYAITFQGSTRPNPNAEQPYSLYGLYFATAAGSFNIGGSTLTIGDGGIAMDSSVSSVNPQTISCAGLVLTSSTSAQSWSISSGGLTITAPISGDQVTVNSMGGGTLTLSGANQSFGNFNTANNVVVQGGDILSGGKFTVNSSFFATISMIVTGAGTQFNSSMLELSGTAATMLISNGASVTTSFLNVTAWPSTSLTVSAATLTVPTSTAPGDNGVNLEGTAGSLFTVTNGGKVVIGGSLWMGTEFQEAQQVTVTGAGSTLSVGGTTMAGANGGTGSLTVSNGGQVTLHDMDANSGTLTVTGGGKMAVETRLHIGDTNFTNESAVVTGSGSLLTADSIALGTFSGKGSLTVSNGGQVITTKDLDVNQLSSGTGSLIINGGNVTAGNLLVGTNSATTTIQISNPSASLADGYALVVGSDNINRTISIPISNAAGGPGGIDKVGKGILTLTGNSTYSGGTKIDDGTLVGRGTGLGNGAVIIGSGATLAVGELVNTKTTAQAIGTLTISSLVLAAGSTTPQLTFNLGISGTADTLKLTGSGTELTFSGAGDINIGFASATGGPLGAGTYNLITFATPESPDFAPATGQYHAVAVGNLVSLNPDYVFAYQLSNGNITGLTLTISGANMPEPISLAFLLVFAPTGYLALHQRKRA